MANINAKINRSDLDERLKRRKVKGSPDVHLTLDTLTLIVKYSGGSIMMRVYFVFSMEREATQS